LGGEEPPVITTHTIPIFHIEKLNVQTYSDMVFLDGIMTNYLKTESYLIPNIENTLFMQTDDEIEFSHAQIVTGLEGNEEVLVDKIEHLGKGQAKFSFVPKKESDSSTESYRLKVVRNLAGREHFDYFELPSVHNEK
jgi:hypothetical protein